MKMSTLGAMASESASGKTRTALKTVKHSSLPINYAPFGHWVLVAPILRKGCLKARDILNSTARAFVQRDDNKLSDIIAGL